MNLDAGKRAAPPITRERQVQVGGFGAEPMDEQRRLVRDREPVTKPGDDGRGLRRVGQRRTGQQEHAAEGLPPSLVLDPAVEGRARDPARHGHRNRHHTVVGTAGRIQRGPRRSLVATCRHDAGPCPDAAGPARTTSVQLWTTRNHLRPPRPPHRSREPFVPHTGLAVHDLEARRSPHGTREPFVPHTGLAVHE